MVSKRSAHYPSATWTECLELIERLESLGRGGSSIELLAQAFNLKNPKTKSLQSKVSSSRLFGLISIKSGAVTLTEEGYALLHPTVPDVRPLELELFARPKLYKGLLEAYEGKSLPRRDLFENILVKDYGLSDASKTRAAQCFVESSEQLGVLSNGIISYQTACNGCSNVAEEMSNDAEPSDTSGAVSDEHSSEATVVSEAPTASSTPTFTLNIPVVSGGGYIEIRIPENAQASDLRMAREMLGVYIKSKGIEKEEVLE